MVVGSDRHQAALLVIPNGHLDVGPLLDDLNTNAPKHSQIVSELVKILPEDSTFVLSDKGSIKRAKSIAKYEVEIEALFAAYEGAGGEGGNVTSLKEAETLVDNVLQTVFRRDYATGDDFFDLGMDSLVAIRIRNAIQRRVNFALSSNVVFEHPSAHDLAEHIWHLAQGILGNSVSSSSTQAASDMAFKAKAAVVCREFPKGGPIQSVLLTGATGSLGAHILHQLAGRKIQVYCLCRAGDDDDAARRVDRSLQMRQLPSLEDLQLWSRIDCIKADLADAHLGLSAQAYNTLKSVDAIIHSAWPVNFNLSLASFKPHINGIVNLLNLAPAANFAFISSISAASCGSTEPVPEIIDPDPNTAGSIGYAQSKWVAEQLCGEASIFRIGQISGDSIHGIWNSAEAPAAMIRSAQELGVMPDNDVAGDKVSWLPVDHAAWVVVQLAMSEAAPTVYNLVNYVTTPWSVILEALRETVSFDRVPYKKWLSMLQAASRRGDDAEAIPALKLIEYFAHKDHGVGRRFETEGVRTALVKVMERNGASDEDVQRELSTRFSPITRQAMNKIVSAWRTNGFLQ